MKKEFVQFSFFAEKNIPDSRAKYSKVKAANLPKKVLFLFLKFIAWTSLDIIQFVDMDKKARFAVGE